MREAAFKRIYAYLAAHGPRSLLVNGGAYWTAYTWFWRHFRRRSPDDVLGTHWKYEDEFLRLLSALAGDRSDALEIGCGGGRITLAAAPMCRSIVATDVSRGMLGLARKALLAYANVSFRKIDGFTLSSFADESFDLVYSHDVFVHFSSLQVYPYLLEIRRVLRPGGAALLSFYSFKDHFGKAEELALQYQKARKVPPHMRIHFITEEMLRIMAGAAGLEVEVMESAAFLLTAFRKKT